MDILDFKFKQYTITICLLLRIIRRTFRCHMVHFVFWTPWYIKPRGQFSSMVYWTSLLKNEPPLYGKLNPYCILNPLIFNQEIGRGFDIPWVEGGVNILWVGVRNTMGRGFDIPWIGVQNAMGKGSKYHEYGVRFWLLRWCQNTYLCPKLPNAFPFFFFGSIFGGIVAHRIWPMTYDLWPFSIEFIPSSS